MQRMLHDMSNDAVAINTRLGAIRLDYLTKEAVLLKQSDELDKNYRSLLNTVAKACGIDLATESWRFDQQAMTFTKVEAAKEEVAVTPPPPPQSPLN